MPEGYCIEITFFNRTHQKIIEELYKNAVKVRKGSITIFFFSGGYESQRFITSLKQVSDGLPECPQFKINYPYISI
jgi:hypothetical protein